MKLSIGALGNTIFEVSLSRNLNDTENIEVRLQQQQNNGPQDVGAGGAADNQQVAAPAEQQQGAPPLGANAEAGDAAPAPPPPPQGRLKITVAADDADKEFLHKMRGWLMTVATLFVSMAFQAMLHPPDWLKMEWIYMYKAKKHGKAGSPLAAPAPSPSPPTAGPTYGEVMRAASYITSNIATFGTALALVLVLLWETPSPRRTISVVRKVMPMLSFSLACTMALGTVDNWGKTAVVCAGMVGYAVGAVLVSLGILRQLTDLCLRCFRREAIPHAHDA